MVYNVCRGPELQRQNFRCCDNSYISAFKFPSDQ